MRIPAGIVLLLSLAITASARESVAVSYDRKGDSLRFVVVERSSQGARGRPATRRYQFTTPMDTVVTAAQIRDYFARYEGADGIWETHREPVAGYIILSHFQRPRAAEFRLLERWDSHIVPMTINGHHRVRPLDK